MSDAIELGGGRSRTFPFPQILRLNRRESLHAGSFRLLRASIRSGMVFNLANLALVGFLVMRHPGRARIVKDSFAAHTVGEDASLPRVVASLDNTP